MINRQQGVVIGVGVALAVACLVIGVLFFRALATSGEAKGKRDEAYDQLKALYQSKIFPNDTNIQRLKEDTQVLQAWTAEVSNVLARAALKVDDLTNVRFKQELQKNVRALTLEKSASSGKPFVDSEFKFGFDRYLGTETLPKESDVAQLAQQLKLVHLIVSELYEAKITKLTEVEREVFEADTSERRTGTTAPNRRVGAAVSRPGQSSGTGAKTTNSDELSPVLSTMLVRQKFSFGFQANPAALTRVLNRLAAMDAFVVVSGVEFTKAEDSIQLADQRKKSAMKAAEEARTTAASPAETPRDRIVTDPEREPQLNVKLSVDVYLFKGV